jgi:hypothetical protein
VLLHGGRSQTLGASLAGTCPSSGSRNRERLPSVFRAAPYLTDHGLACDNDTGSLSRGCLLIRQKMQSCTMGTSICSFLTPIKLICFHIAELRVFFSFLPPKPFALPRVEPQRSHTFRFRIMPSYTLPISFKILTLAAAGRRVNHCTMFKNKCLAVLWQLIAQE